MKTLSFVEFKVKQTDTKLYLFWNMKILIETQKKHTSRNKINPNEKVHTRQVPMGVALNEVPHKQGK